MTNLKEVVKFSVAFAHGVDKALADNKLTVLDLPHFFQAFMLAPEAFKDAHLIKDEIKAMKEEDKKLLVEEIKAELSLDSKKTEEIIEKSVELVFGVISLVKLIKA